jgi:hypothetical protein
LCGCAKPASLPHSAAGLSRKIRALAAEFADRGIAAEALRTMSDTDIEPRLTASRHRTWAVHGFALE